LKVLNRASSQICRTDNGVVGSSGKVVADDGAFREWVWNVLTQLRSFTRAVVCSHCASAFAVKAARLEVLLEALYGFL
jgi:hypothetical protein